MSDVKNYYFICLDQRGNEGTVLFWRPNRQGYTSDIDLAGLYSRADADELNKRGRDIALTFEELKSIEDVRFMRVVHGSLYDLKVLKKGLVEE